ncbi:GNAT family N-acetyltransferase [Streptomyces roseifaciens]|uniref:GNAT family N-acetyltransferase n=1 Tax=Streptomyces roseifaciens TaxID=1488406 RepID=UPI000718318E|nr:GNAT family N-acetyltransferase [Streptomyces roseifaciens]
MSDVEIRNTGIDLRDIEIRPATTGDVPAIVALLADDPIGAGREAPGDLAPYRTAFDRVDADPHQQLVVAVHDGRVVGTLQLTVIPGLSRAGMTRGLIEGVRVHGDARGSGLGSLLVEWALDAARRAGCRMAQLTSDATRVDAHRFYERLGFEASHLGFKYHL